MEKVDAVVMGRRTFDVVHSFGEWIYTKPVFVLSRTLKELPEGYEDKAELIMQDPATINDELKTRGFENLYIDGGQVIRNFLRLDLIDEMIITRIPLLLSEGIPLFGEQNGILRFRHEETVVYDNGLVKSYYIRDR
jgi:dihydrofolate reductase